jgi:hypothetical protein
MQVHFPDDFPLRGIERDTFEAKLRDALHYVFKGSRVQQLADQIDARRAFTPSGALPLRRIGDEHAFEECLSLDHCRFEDMSAALRRKVLNAVGERLGLTLTVPGLTLDPDGEEADAGAPQPATAAAPAPKPTVVRGREIFATVFVLILGAGTALAGAAAWKIAHPAPVPVVATVVSTSSPAQTLRELASSVPDDRQPYRVSVQVEPQAPAGAAR